MTEFEKKLILTKNEYSCLMKYYGKGKPVVQQINYYFDTYDLAMNRNNITCRIRLKDGSYKGTIKRHLSNADDSTETSIEVRNGIYNNTFTDMGLKLQGELITKRCVVLKDSVCEVVLDKNDYLGYTDYELEVEYLPNHEKDACAILQTLFEEMTHCDPALTSFELAERVNNAKSKSKRFFNQRNLI